MPKRVVDGEAIWTSKKLRLVNPIAFRAEYTSLIPLATANGTFECDPDMVWSRVYAYNRPDVNRDLVARILDEFERVKLLFRWQDECGNWFGFWIGIDKPGRLPGESRQGKHEKVATTAIPLNKLRMFLESKNFHHGNNLLLGFGSGSGLCSGSEADEREQIMSRFTDALNKICMERFHHLGEGKQLGSQTWKEMNALVDVYGAAAVLEKFEQFAASATGADQQQYPISAFCRLAKHLFAGEKTEEQATAEVDIRPLLAELTLISHSEVVFNETQQKQLSKLLENHTSDEVITVFREFYGRINTEYEARFAAKNFCAGAGALIDARRLDLQRQQAGQRELDRLAALDRQREEAKNSEREAGKQSAPSFSDFDPTADE